MAVVVALLLLVLAGMAALVVDLGYLTTARAQLQTAVDAGAHAGAMQLDGTEEGLAAAADAAVTIAGLNATDGEAVALSPTDDIALGVWDEDAAAFTEGGTAAEIDAVRVDARRDDLPAWFAEVAFGRESQAASATAVARRRYQGAGEVDCFLPLAVPACVIEDVYGMGGVNMIDLVLNPVGVNNVAWARPLANPSASWLSDQIWNCESDGTVEVSDSVNLNNGVINSVLQDLADSVEASPTAWDTDLWGALPAQGARSGIAPLLYGHTLEGPIMVFEDDSYCTSPHAMNGTEEVTGFVWGAIYEVLTSGPAAQRTIRMRLETLGDHDLGTGGGGPDYGVVYRHLALVQ